MKKRKNEIKKAYWEGVTDVIGMMMFGITFAWFMFDFIEKYL